MALWSKYDWDSKTAAFSFFLWWPAKQTGPTWSHKLLELFHGEIRRYIYVWKATGTHGFLKHYLINYRNCFTGRSEDEKKIYLCRWAWGEVTEFPFILLCVSVCVQLDADKWWYWQKHSFQQQRVRSCVGEIFFSMLPGGVANINTGGTSYKIISRADMKT